MNQDLQNLIQEAARMFAIHSTWVLLLVFALSKGLRNTFLKRALWRSSFVALSLLILVTFSGLYQWDWFSVTPFKQQAQTISERQTHWKPMTLVKPPASDTIKQSSEIFEPGDSFIAPPLTVGIGWIWLLGSVSLIGLMVFNAASWRWRLRRQTQPASEDLQSVFNHAAKQLNFTKTPTLSESPNLNSPLVMGCIRPLIAFPVDHATRYNPTEQHLIMCHEIAHLKEHDGWWQCLSNMVAVVLWWSPLVWMARQCLRQAAEETADSMSASHQQHGEQLAACLVRIGRQMSSTKWSGSLSIFGAGFKSQLGKRVERLLHPHPKMSIRPKPTMMGAIRLLTPALLTAFLFGSVSWLGLSRTESASDSVQRSVFGMALFAQDTKGSGAVSTGAHEHQNESEPIKVSDDQSQNAQTTMEQRLKSIVIPEFKMAVANIDSGLNIHWDNLRELRESILSIDPSWENLTFFLRGNLTQGSSPGLSINAVGHVKMGPLKQPDDLPPINSGKSAPFTEDLPDSAIYSNDGIVTFFKLANTSAYDLLMRIMYTSDHQDHFVFRSDIVVFDVDVIEGTMQQGFGPILPTENNPFTLALSPIQTPNSRTTRIKDLPSSKQETDPTALYTRTFKVNPDTLIERMEAVLGYPKPTETHQTWTNVQDLVHELFSKIGIELPDKEQRAMPNQDLKGAFFNDRNGKLFVRLTLKDLDILEAALAVLQEPGERNTRVTLDMHIVQLDENGIKVLEEFGFDKPGGENDSPFEHIINTPTLERLLLRMNLAQGVELLQSPHITALNGRQSELKALELRRIVISHESGNIQTKEVATGPSLSVIPRIQANGHLEMTAHFEMLEFLGYDDPGPFRVVAQNNPPTTTDASPNKERSTIDVYKEMLKEMDLAPKRETPQIILKHMPHQLKLKQLSNELETAHQTKVQFESKVSKNAKDTINTQRNLASLNTLIPTLQKQVDQEVAIIRRHILTQMVHHENSGNQTSNSNPRDSSVGFMKNGPEGEPAEKAPVPLPRFKRLELNSTTTLQSGQTLIMGGLKSMETIQWKNSVPVMSKIPLLGGLFRREGTSTAEQYLYVLITPSILK